MGEVKVRWKAAGSRWRGSVGSKVFPLRGQRLAQLAVGALTHLRLDSALFIPIPQRTSLTLLQLCYAKRSTSSAAEYRLLEALAPRGSVVELKATSGSAHIQSHPGVFVDDQAFVQQSISQGRTIAVAWLESTVDAVKMSQCQILSQ